MGDRTLLGPYELIGRLGAGAPASAPRAGVKELWRGHAEALARTR